MQHLQSDFKFGLIFIIVFAMNSCKDIPRDNILDPKNPDSYRAQVISLEAFVNTNNDQQYNEHMLSALRAVTDKYNGKIIYLQYHRNTTLFTDSLALPENEILYEQYLNSFDDGKGVPDVFINGTADRIKGASSIGTAFERIDNAVQSLLIKNTFFTIEPIVKRSNSNVSISTKIARLGSESISDILIRSTITENIDSNVHTRVVRQMENSNLIPRLEPGEQKEINFSDYSSNSNEELYVIITVTSRLKNPSKC